MKPGKYVWRRPDGDFPVTVLKSLGKMDGREYVQVKESTTGIPFDECLRPDTWCYKYVVYETWGKSAKRTGEVVVQFQDAGPILKELTYSRGNCLGGFLAKRCKNQ
jgi:hypothetical protein